MGQKIKHPIGIQDFAKLREYGYVYVDKTEYINKPVALLLETGYLTITHYDPETENYILGIPNSCL